MTLLTTDYLEYYLTLVAWIVHNGIWAIVVTSGVIALPFLAIILGEWLNVRTEGADEGNKGVLSAARIENRVFVAIVVVMFAGIPFIDVDLNTIQYDSSRSAQCQVSVPQPTDTGWSQSFSTINNQSAKVPRAGIRIARMTAQMSMTISASGRFFVSLESTFLIKTREADFYR